MEFGGPYPLGQILDLWFRFFFFFFFLKDLDAYLLLYSSS